MKNKKIDIKKIKEREVTEKEIEENKKETKKKEWLLYRVPIILDSILALIYILTSNNILLIPISIIFALVLYGIDCHQRICKKCKKWNSTIMLKDGKLLQTKKVTKKNVLGKDKVKEEKNILSRKQSKCINCGYIHETEIIK